MYFRMRALEKHNAKKTQYQVDQVYADKDDDDQDEDYSGPNDNMTNWTKEDFIDYQNGSYVPGQRKFFDEAKVIQFTFEP